jgi:TPR repeat protein
MSIPERGKSASSSWLTARFELGLALATLVLPCGGCVRTEPRQIATTTPAPVAPAPDSVAALRLACREGEVRACETLALRLIASGQASERDEAVPLLRRLCDESSARACTALGDYRNWHLPWRPGRARRDVVEAYRRACELGRASSCRSAAQELEQDSKQRLAAVAMFTEGCRRGDKTSCVDLAVHKWRGEGITRDADAAIPDLESLCARAAARACGFLGVLYAAGASVPFDEERALTYLETGCRNVLMSDSCALRAMLIWRSGDHLEGRAAIEGYCETEENGETCTTELIGRADDGRAIDWTSRWYR